MTAQESSSTDLRFGKRRQLGKIQSGLINESSGITPSPNHPDCFWTHNDNGRIPGLFLIDKQGHLRARLDVESISFRDWEDIGCWRTSGDNYLVLADVGDNLSQYVSCRIHIIKLPEFVLGKVGEAPLHLKAEATATLEFTYPDGPCDCETILVDSGGEKIYLVSKSMDPNDKKPSSIYWIPLGLKSTRNPIRARILDSKLRQHMLTGADISVGGDLAVIRSYTSAWLYRRRPNQNWADVLSAADPMARTLLPLQRQGEAICFSPDGKSVLLTSEGLRQPIWQIDLSQLQDKR